MLKQALPYKLRLDALDMQLLLANKCLGDIDAVLLAAWLAC